MAIDLNEEYKFLINRIKAIDTYNEVSRSTTVITNQQQSNLEKNSQETLSPLSQLSEQKKRYQRQVKTQLGKLLDIDKLIPENRFTGRTSSSTSSFVKDSFSEALDEIKSRLPQIISDEIIKELGCSQEQTYEPTTIYIPVESIDIFGSLKETPESTIGKLFYEVPPISVQSKPFSMNRELYQRIQNPGLSYKNEYGQDYRGISQQNLFNFTYETQDNLGNNGNFLKIELLDRVDGKNLVGQFVVDYFNTIKIVDTKNIFLQLFEFLFGAISINLKLGVGEIGDKGYFSKIIQRILGLCFDSNQEIDVSGIAKVAPLDGIDESFFELTDVDLRTIESAISNVKLGVFEYIDCTNIKQPFNDNEVLDNLLRLLNVDDSDSAGNTSILNETIETIKEKLIGPKFELGITIDDDIVNQLPTALYSAVISPKVLLPMMIMIRTLESAQGNTQTSILNEVFNLESFVKKFSRFNIEVVSKIGATFVVILRDIIIRDIRKLTRQISRNLRNELTRKKLLQTQSLLALSILLTRTVVDFRKCKSVVDSIVEIVELALRGSRFDIPQVALLFAQYRSGFSDTRAMLETIEQMQSYGIPTGPMPDGSPNLWLLSIKALIEGTERERAKNSKTQQIIPPLKISPIGVTFPERSSGITS
jgi:hypothetical protein